MVGTQPTVGNFGGIMPEYAPLSSVWDGNDAELLEKMLKFYPREEPKVIIDTTHNTGRFWKGTTRKIWAVDIDPQFNTEFVCDNTHMPFGDGFADVLVYDPPFLSDQETENSSDIWKDRFGLTERLTGDNVTQLFAPFMTEAHRVLKDGGVLFCKIGDGVHNHKYQFQHIDLIMAGRSVGFTACDCIIKVRKSSLISSKWKNAHHARSCHCFWIVFRKSKKCE